MAADAACAADAADIIVHALVHSPSSPTNLAHAAGALADAPLAATTAVAARAAAAPKAAAAAKLLTNLASAPLAAASLFSSVASLVGPPGSAAYGAANASLDAAAAAATAAGTPTVAIQWGAWSDLGMVAHSDAVGRAMRRAGLAPLAPAAGLSALDAAAVDAASPVVAALAADWPAFRASGRGVATLAGKSFFDELCGGVKKQEVAAVATTATPAETHPLPTLPPTLDAPSSSADTTAASAVAAALAAVLGGAPPPASFPLAAAGIDSLAAVELRDELSASLGIPLPATLAFDAPTVGALTARVADELRRRGKGGGEGVHIAPAVPTPPPPPPRSPTTAATIAITAHYSRLAPPDVDTARLAPLERWDADAGPPRGHARTAGARWSRWLPHAAAFDGAAFRVPHAEAVRLDPQQRLMLEAGAAVLATWGGGGDTPSSTPPTAVAACLSFWDYASILSASHPTPDPGDAYAATGKCLSVAAGRLAYTFDLAGAALAVDTACSSSLVAAALLARDLRALSSRRAVLTATLLSLDPAIVSGLGAAAMLALDGRVKALDAAANGYGRGEGVVALGLEAVDMATPTPSSSLILAAIAVNQDGRSASLTAPSGVAQEAVLRAGAEAAHTHTLSALEMHGTGTPLGDPIELGAAVRVHGGGSASPLALAASKTASGHVEPAAGGVALLGAWRRLATGDAAPLHHLTTPSPHVVTALDAGAASVPRARAPTPGGSAVGVSTFAFQGTNAHAVVVAGTAAGLPTPPHRHWRHARVWFAPAAARLAARMLHGATFAADLAAAPLAYLWQHVVKGRPLLPGAAMLEAAVAAVAVTGDGSGATVTHAAIVSPLLLPVGEAAPGLTTSIDGDGGITLTAGGVTLLTALAARVAVVSSTQSRSRRRLRRFGSRSSPPAASTAALAPPASTHHASGYCVHPAHLDAAIHLGALRSTDAGSRVAVPTAAGAVVAPAPAFDGSSVPWTVGGAPVSIGGRVHADYSMHGGVRVGGLVSTPLKGKSDANAAPPLAIYTEDWQVACVPARRGPPRRRRRRVATQVAAVGGALAVARAVASTHALPPLVDDDGGQSSGPTGCLDTFTASAYRGSAACAALEPGVRVAESGAPAARHSRVVRTARGPPASSPPLGTYLIIGGTGGLGSLAAAWLAGGGRAHTICVGRRATAPPQHDGVVAAADASTAADAAWLADLVHTSAHAPRGLLLASGALADGAARGVRPAAARAAAAPKIATTVALCRLTTPSPLHTFTAYTSASAVAGNPGQTAYGGANGALAALARSARSAGVPASDAGWGPWTGVGMAAAAQGLLRRLAAGGLASLAPAHGLAALAAVVSSAIGGVLVGRFAWRQLLSVRGRGTDGRFDEFEVVESKQEEKEVAVVPTTPPTEAVPPTITATSLLPTVLSALRTVVGADVPPDAPLTDAGVDSLGALALRDALAAAVGGAPLPATLAFDFPTAAALTFELERRVGGGRKKAEDVAAAAVPLPPPRSAITSPPPTTTTIAIVGAGCAFPAASTPTAFWHAAVTAASPAAPIPLDRWDADTLFSADAAPRRAYARLAATLPGFDAIDAAWCRLGPGDAAALDPACRRLLEMAATARADAVTRGAVSITDRATATYVGCMFYDAADVARHGYGVPSGGAVVTGVGAPYLAGRSAFHFDAGGGCVGIDTACSSSLVAVHEGRQGECGGEKERRETHAPVVCPSNKPPPHPPLPSHPHPPSARRPGCRRQRNPLGRHHGRHLRLAGSVPQLAVPHVRRGGRRVWAW